jgi:hypothetical protein
MAETSSVEAEAIEAIEQYLKERPGTMEVRDVRNDPSYRAADVDLLWTCASKSGQPRTAKLEVKADRWHRTGNFFFETQSNKDKDTPGCFLYTEADYLLYYFVTPRALYILPMPETRDWFLANRDRFPVRETSTPVAKGKHYITVGRLVPIAEVMEQVTDARKRQL